MTGSLSAFWHRAWAMVVTALPESLTRRLPPVVEPIAPASLAH